MTQLSVERKLKPDLVRVIEDVDLFLRLITGAGPDHGVFTKLLENLRGNSFVQTFDQGYLLFEINLRVQSWIYSLRGILFKSEADGASQVHLTSPSVGLARLG